MKVTMNHPHGRLGPTKSLCAQPDPFNNVGRWCDVSHTFGYGVKGDRGWSVRQYQGKYPCGCHIYLVTHEELPTGMVASMDRVGNDCKHSTMGNLY